MVATLILPLARRLQSGNEPQDGGEQVSWNGAPRYSHE